MAYDGTLIFDTEVDTSGFSSGVNKIETSANELLKANIFGNLLSDGISKAIDSLKDAAVHGVELASDLQEVENVVDTTFGKGANDIYEWSEAADEGFGISSLAAQNFTGSLGAMLKSSGLASDAISVMSTDLTGLAGDMASFYNLDVSAAFEKIRSGISGETEPLKQLGINMSAANLEAYALAQGINKAYSEMSQAEQVQLRYNYLMNATIDAQGDFAKTSESFANQQRIFQLNIESLSGVLGGQFLPILNDVIISFNEKLPEAEPVIESIGMALSDAAVFIMDNGEAIIALVAVYGTYKAAVGAAAVAQAALNAAMNINPVTAMITGLGLATAAVVSLAKSYKEANPSAVELREEFENTKQTLSDTKTELEKVQESIDSLESKGVLTVVEQQQLDMLKETNEELEREIENLETIAEINKSEARLTAMDEYTSSNNDFENIKSNIMSLEEAKKELENAYAEKDRLEADGLNEFAVGHEEYQHYVDTLGKIDITTGAIESYTSQITAFYEKMSEWNKIINEDGIESQDLMNDTQYLADYLGISEEQVQEITASTVSLMADYYAQTGKAAVENQKKQAEIAAEQQKENTRLLQEGWNSAEHNYAIGAISSESELYRQKQQLWDEYGNANLEEHWSYYEDLIGYQQDYAERSKSEYEQQLRSEWTSIDHQLQLGLVSEEEAYKKKLAFIQKYCPEYSDEWYDYYKEVYDYQQNASDEQLELLKNSMQEQVDTVSDGLNDILSRYKDTYKDIQSNIENYKNKLLSLGEAFSVIENDDGSKTLRVNNLKEQMAEMEKYHSYIKKLKSQKASAGLLSELTSMDGEEGFEFAKNLANMSSADFEEINNYYKKRDELAQEMAQELYQPEIDSLNKQLTESVITKFGELPEAVRLAGVEALTAFMEGFSGDDYAEQLEMFINNFVDELSACIDNGIAFADIDFNAIYEQDAYSAGLNMGNDFVSGFNAAIEEMQTAVKAEQAEISAKYTAEKLSVYSVDQHNASSSAEERNVIENHVYVQLDVDGEKVAEKVIEYEETLNRGKGK